MLKTEEIKTKSIKVQNAIKEQNPKEFSLTAEDQTSRLEGQMKWQRNLVLL